MLHHMSFLLPRNRNPSGFQKFIINKKEAHFEYYVQCSGLAVGHWICKLVYALLPRELHIIYFGGDLSSLQAIITFLACLTAKGSLAGIKFHGFG